MDYRGRKYYLARFYDYDKAIESLKANFYTLKFHKPYNHFRNDKANLVMKMKSSLSNPDVYDGDSLPKTTYVQVMIGCNYNEVDKFENFIKEMKNKGKSEFERNYTYIYEVTKEYLKQ